MNVAEVSGILEAFIFDPLPRPVGVVMWQMITFPEPKGKTFYLAGAVIDSALTKELLRLWESKKATEYVSVPRKIDDKNVRVRLKDLLALLEKHV